MALGNVQVLAQTVVGCDAYTETSVAEIRIGDPAWQWDKRVVFVRVRPSVATDAAFVERFRGSLAPWRRRHVLHNPDLFDIEDGAELFALFEYDRGVSLEVICDSLTPATPMPRAIVARVLDAVFIGLRGRHELDIAHGAVSLENISIRPDGGVTIGVGRPWDPAARPRDDLRCAERLSRELLARSSAVSTRETLCDFARRFG
jgi:hypothetical protein